MKIKITEDQYNSSIERSIEEDYPTSWNVDEFKKLKSFNQRINYCENNLQRISSGSGRVVYKIDDTKVLKLAKNKKGLAQNETEIDLSKDYLWDGLIGEIFNYDENNLWTEMELARKVTPKIFQEITNMSFNDYCDSIRYYDSEQRRSSYKPNKPESYDDIWENEFGTEMLTLIGSYDLPVGDLCRLSTYGVVNRDGRNDIVMIDYGLTRDVYDSYYS